MKTPNIVYHVSRLKNRRSIKTFGIFRGSTEIAKSYLKLHDQSYKDRVYLSLDLESAEKSAEFLSSYLDSQSIFEYSFICIFIDFSKYLQDCSWVKVYKDPDFGPQENPDYEFNGQGGIFIKEDIPPEYILRITTVKV